MNRGSHPRKDHISENKRLQEESEPATTFSPGRKGKTIKSFRLRKEKAAARKLQKPPPGGAGSQKKRICSSMLSTVLPLGGLLLSEGIRR